MDENLDLRNRILKMRENNNLVLDQQKFEDKKIKSNYEYNSQKLKNNVNLEEESLNKIKDIVNPENKLDEQNSAVNSKKMVKSNLFKNESVNSNIVNEKKSNQKTLNNLVNNNEAQFRMIAKKFNEAVEVILELSDKVKELEETVNVLSNKSGLKSKKHPFFNLKSFVLIIISTLLLFGLFTLPFDLTLIKLIIIDVIESI